MITMAVQLLAVSSHVAIVMAGVSVPDSNAAVFVQLSATRLEFRRMGRVLSRSSMSLYEDKARDDISVSCPRDTRFCTRRGCDIYAFRRQCLNMRRTVTWLASYPGSGNTWTRVLLETATGMYTGSMYHDKSLVGLGMKGEGITDPKRVVVVKTHIYPWDRKPKKGRAIVLVRNPLDAVLSHSHIYLATRNGNSMHSAETHEATMRRHFSKHRDERLTRWKDFMTFWLAYKRDAKIFIRYEDLRADARGILSDQILPFLKIRPRRLGKQLDCALQPEVEPPELIRNHSYEFKFQEEDYAAVKSILGNLPSKFGYSY